LVVTPFEVVVIEKLESLGYRLTLYA